MRRSIREFVSLVTETIPTPESICEFGSLQVPGQETLADLRPLFPGKVYMGCDMREGRGVDRILNLHDIDLPSASVGTVLCLDTLEHVEYPHRAMEEVCRILRPDGVAVISSVMQFPVHDHPCDYWRFTTEAFRSMLKPLSHSFVGFAGDEGFPHTVVGIGFKGEQPPLDAFLRAYGAWQKGQSRSLGSIARSLTPPFLLPTLLSLRRGSVRAARASRA